MSALVILSAVVLIGNGDGNLKLPADLRFLQPLHPVLRSVADSAQSPSVIAIKRELVELQMERDALLIKYLPDRPEIQEVDIKISALKRSLESSGQDMKIFIKLTFTRSFKTVSEVLAPHLKIPIRRDGSFFLPSGSYGTISGDRKGKTCSMTIVEAFRTASLAGKVVDTSSYFH